ncbi:MAG: sulfatase-like hydrolase/transferase [Proteobacteria bacterium]|nr:sulfatase-like hydrolase/transferase [Pseudomonadota bacterium]
MLLLMACAGEPEPPARKPDILVVVLDTVRADHVMADLPTPQLQAVADAGVVFTSASSSSWTWPSHASLFTGQAPWEHGAHFTEGDGLTVAGGWIQVSPMRRDAVTLAERFSAEGYRTAAVGANALLDPDLGLTRGFEQVAVYPNHDVRVLQEVDAVLAAEDDRPLLLFVNLYAAHAPWEIRDATQALQPRLDAATWLDPWKLNRAAIAPHAGRTQDEPDMVERWLQGDLEIDAEGWELINQLYNGEVMHVDRELNHVLTSWNTSGRSSGVVAVTSDHGELLGERGMVLHCRSLYPELTHVPLVLAGPGVPTGQTVQTPVQLRELYGALLQLAGIEDGSSLLGTLDTPRTDPLLDKAWKDGTWATRIGGRYTQGYEMVRHEGWALISGTTSGHELYDLETDPGMTMDLSEAHPDRVDALRQHADFVEERPTGLLEVDDATQERLRAMGYIQ